MHRRLSELLEHEVVGEVIPVGGSFFDVAHGRICLDRLDPDHINGLVERLRGEFGREIKVEDHLHLKARDPLLRGLFNISFEDPDMGTLYLLQITSHHVASFFERRFMLDAETFADLLGTVNQGLYTLVIKGENPLRIISGFDQLLDRYRDGLDTVLQAAVAGAAVGGDPSELEASRDTHISYAQRQAELKATDEPSVEALLSLVDGVRDAWTLIPWTLRAGRKPVSESPRERLCRHDRVFESTSMFAADIVRGEPSYGYCHVSAHREDYDQTIGWMVELYERMQDEYPAPHGVSVMARASSIETFLKHFPGYRPVVGATFSETE